MAYRRRLPHLQAGHRPVFLTWRLYGSLPPNRVFGSEASSGHAFVAMDSILNRPGGPLHLRRPEIAELMIKALLYGQDRMKYYQLRAWVVMANHIHVLLTPFMEIPEITHSLKRFTAREANRMLGLTGQPFWQDEVTITSCAMLVSLTGLYAISKTTRSRLVLSSAPAHFPWSSAARRG